MQNLWAYAWDDAIKTNGGSMRGSGFAPNDGALVINAPSYRDQHQMHIHSGAAAHGPACAPRMRMHPCLHWCCLSAHDSACACLPQHPCSRSRAQHPPLLSNAGVQTDEFKQCVSAMRNTVTSTSTWSKDIDCPLKGYKGKDVTMVFKGILVQDLSQVWRKYVEIMNSGTPGGKAAAPWYHGIAVARAFGNNKWFVIVFTSKKESGNKQIGDHAIVISPPTH